MKTETEVIAIRWSRFLPAAAAANFLVGVIFAAMYAFLPFGFEGELHFFQQSDWGVRLIASMFFIGVLAIPIPTLLSCLALRAFFSSSLSWMVSTSVGSVVAALSIPLFVWAWPSNWIMTLICGSLGSMLSILLVKRFGGVVHAAEGEAAPPS